MASKRSQIWRLKYWNGGKSFTRQKFSRAEYGHPSSVSRLRATIVEHKAEKVRLINTWQDLEQDSGVQNLLSPHPYQRQTVTSQINEEKMTPEQRNRLNQTKNSLNNSLKRLSVGKQNVYENYYRQDQESSRNRSLSVGQSLRDPISIDSAVQSNKLCIVEEEPPDQLLSA